jgi:hypothetical protein
VQKSAVGERFANLISRDRDWAALAFKSDEVIAQIPLLANAGDETFEGEVRPEPSHDRVACADLVVGLDCADGRLHEHLLLEKCPDARP